MPTTITLTPIDWVIVAAYFLGIIYLAFRLRGGMTDETQFFLAGRSLSWPFVALSLFATDMSSMAFIAVAGTGFLYGMLYAHFQWFTCIPMLLLAFFLLPFFLRTGIFTMPEFLARRYGSSLQIFFSIITLLLFLLVDIPIALLATAKLMHALIPGLGVWEVIIFIAIITTAYTLMGGLKAVVYTDFIQSILIFIGGLCVTILAVRGAGGWSHMVDQAPTAFWDAFRPASHPTIPWTGIVTGIALMHIWFWTTNQSIMQRVLAAKDLGHARSGVLTSALLKFTIPFLGLIPGIAGFLLYPEFSRAVAEGGGLTADDIYPRLVVTLLMPGMRGLVVVVLFAALMSTIDSILNSAMTLAVNDLYSHWRPEKAKGKSAVFAGRVVGVVIMVIGVLLVSLYLDQGSIYERFQQIYGYTAAPIVVVFIAGILWRKINTASAIATFVTGLATAILVRQYLPQIHWLVSVGVAAVVSVITIAIVPLLPIGRAPSDEQLADTTLFGVRKGRLAHVQDPAILKSNKLYLGLTALLVILAAGTFVRYGLLTEPTPTRVAMLLPENLQAAVRSTLQGPDYTVESLGTPSADADAQLLDTIQAAQSTHQAVIIAEHALTPQAIDLLATLPNSRSLIILREAHAPEGATTLYRGEELPANRVPLVWNGEPIGGPDSVNFPYPQPEADQNPVLDEKRLITAIHYAAVPTPTE